MKDNTTTKTADELEASITLKLLASIDSANSKEITQHIANYGDFQAACYRRAYIAQIGKLPVKDQP